MPDRIGRLTVGQIQVEPVRFDFTMSKNVRFSESVRLQLRAEAFNIFNHTNFRSFGSLNNTSSVFGTISGFRDPRIMQFGAKISF